MGYFKEFFSGIYNLLLGLKTTAKYLPERAVTLQYPKEKWPMPERSRGIVVLLSDPDTGELNCTACLLCQKACPVAAITITQAKNETTNKRYPKTFEVNNTICCFCGLCEEACNFDAIKLTGLYEFATFDKESLIFQKEKLQELGRNVKYEKKRKSVAKKPAAKSETTETKPQSAAPSDPPKGEEA
ncbi:MAG: NADH-quinone oxidoreductase subunit I [candidate division Zixibacteria bacterium]|jgi:NADH-quinone oxidoreductase subunit I|nr:NADH-quinone oxidoreductase subunit I [candidate division Zixibacteria bacterium]